MKYRGKNFKLMSQYVDNGTHVKIYLHKDDVLKVEYTPDADEEIIDTIKGEGDYNK